MAIFPAVFKLLCLSLTTIPLHDSYHSCLVHPYYPQLPLSYTPYSPYPVLPCNPYPSRFRLGHSDSIFTCDWEFSVREYFRALFMSRDFEVGKESGPSATQTVKRRALARVPSSFRGCKVTRPDRRKCMWSTSIAKTRTYRVCRKF